MLDPNIDEALELDLLLPKGELAAVLAGVDPNMDEVGGPDATAEPKIDGADVDAAAVFAPNSDEEAAVTDVEPNPSEADGLVADVDPNPATGFEPKIEADAVVAAVAAAEVDPNADGVEVVTAADEPNSDGAEVLTTGLDPNMDGAAVDVVSAVDPNADGGAVVADIDPNPVTGFELKIEVDAVVDPNADGGAVVADVDPNADGAEVAAVGFDPNIEVADDVVAGVDPNRDEGDALTAGFEPNIDGAAEFDPNKLAPDVVDADDAADRDANMDGADAVAAGFDPNIEGLAARESAVDTDAAELTAVAAAEGCDIVTGVEAVLAGCDSLVVDVDGEEPSSEPSKEPDAAVVGGASPSPLVTAGLEEATPKMDLLESPVEA